MKQFFARRLSRLVLLTVGQCLIAIPSSADTYTVANTNDSGAGSLRQAILDANAHANSLNQGSAPDTIAFAISGSGVQTISPTASLPMITDPVIIDGYTQAGSSPNTNATGALNTVLTIELNGASAPGVNGLTIAAGGSTVRGLAINGFTQQGIELRGTGNVVAGNFFGTNVTGTSKQQNGNSGVYVSSANNVIGGVTPAARNLSSGNFFHGVELNGSGASGNVVQGNLLGTNAAGTASLSGTTSFGVFITQGAHANVIGGTAPVAGNVVSGNVLTGILLRDTSGNRIEGNYIGTDASGTADLGNAGSGIGLENSDNNTVGGTVAEARNLISGNNRRGVNIFSGSNGNKIEGNFIGTDVTGTLPLGNSHNGIEVEDSASNTIGGSVSGAGNVISANGTVNDDSDGIAIYGAAATGNLVQGNFVGTDVTGTQPLGNATEGMSAGEDASGNTFGGTSAGAGNLISGNGGDGVAIYEGGTLNKVEGNLIGTDLNGSANLGNGDHGVTVGTDCVNNTVGGTAPGARNVIAANEDAGVLFYDNASSNKVEGNYIGTDASGTTALGNGDDGVLIVEACQSNLIGGTTIAARNIISGNNDSGVVIAGSGAMRNLVQGNFIGTDANGTADLGNTFDGIYIEDAPANTIGGTDSGAGNVISGNDDDGVTVTGATAQGNQISGNLIGRNAVNTGPLGNADHGILLQSSGPATIGGGFNPSNANVIAHNGGDGVAVIFGTGPCIRKGIKSNSIFSNGGLGIDLENDGVTPNDFGDADLGANKLQNFPVLTSASLSGGNVTIEGSFNSEADTNYEIEFFSSEGADPSGHGEGQTFLGNLEVTSDAMGNATISVTLPAPPAGQSIITATATAPDLDDGNTSEFSNAVQIPGAAGRLLNISTRLRVQTGENALIGGFIVTGNQAKKVIVRAIGPSLNSGGVPVAGRLENPTLDLNEGDTTLASNDNWKDFQQAEIEASTIPPSNELEAAIVATLSPGAYTAVMRGKDDATGIGLIEAYDLEQASDSKLANISTRGFVEAGDNVMIGGLIAGGADTRVLLRAIGPSLANSGIAGALADSTLELRDANGDLLRENDNWQESQQAEIEATTIPPTNSAESAIVVTLPPGNYTAVVRGKDGATGVGLVEVYNVE